MSSARHRSLPREPAAVALARRSMREWLRDAEIDDERRGDILLVVSELVTNAVVHASGGSVQLRLVTLDGGYRVEVSDDYPALPLRRRAAGAAVGNGILLLDTLTAGWGVEATPSGKSVWAEFGTARADPSAPADDVQDPEERLRAETNRFQQVTDGVGRDEPLVNVRLLDLPLEVFAHQLARHRELLRELFLVARSPGRRDSDELVELARELELYRGMGESSEEERAVAAEHGRTHVDITYRLPPSAGVACDRLLELLTAADEFARTEALLVLPATQPEVRVREWFLCQISEQCQGSPPRRWVLEPTSS